MNLRWDREETHSNVTRSWPEDTMGPMCQEDTHRSIDCRLRRRQTGSPMSMCKCVLECCSALISVAALCISTTSAVNTVEIGTEVDGVSGSWNSQMQSHAMDRQERMVDADGKAASIDQSDLLIEVEMDGKVMVGVLRSCCIEKIEVEFDLTMLKVDVGELLMRMDHSLVGVLTQTIVTGAAVTYSISHSFGGHALLSKGAVQKGCRSSRRKHRIISTTLLFVVMITILNTDASSDVGKQQDLCE